MRVLLDKLLRLGRDEDGAALVVTLALLMFMYVACAGVFAIGQSAKGRVLLQNACDAAAYSAAVVQADTISRIATINKAMSWTYVSMTRRQMDCIVYNWLKHSLEHFANDEATAKAWYSGRCHGAHRMSKLVLNGHENAPYLQSADDLRSWLGKFSGGHLNTVANKESFYSEGTPPALNAQRLKDQIRADKQTIAAMNAAELRLVDSLAGRMKAAAVEILRINLPDTDTCRYFIADADTGGFDTDLCFKKEGKYLTLQNTAIDEARFLAWIGKGVPRRTFGSGSGDDEWFYRDGGLGLHRTYRTNVAAKPLYATWDWWTWRCIGHDPSGAPIPEYRATVESECRHVYRRCWCESNTSYRSPKFKDSTSKYSVRSALSYSAISYADTIYDPLYFDGERAYPLILSSKYFGTAGTFTVGVAKYNENPWAKVFGSRLAIASAGTDRLDGIFAAFNPYRDVKWTWVFSSAKAGYRKRDKEYDGTRAYRVDWQTKDESWNLCVSDWDAVFVPVRSANRTAVDGVWEDGPESDKDGFLKTWIETDAKWLAFSDCTPPAYQASVESMVKLPRMHNSAGAIHDLNWATMLDFLYH